MDLVVVGLNYRSAGIDERERFAVARDDVPRVCGELVARPEIVEALVLSTCNRVEVYAVPAPGCDDEAAAATVREVIGAGGVGGFTMVAGVAAVKHLCRVCSSLDSMVLGEPQILGQVKEAFDLARGAGTVGPRLHGLFTRAFRVAKRVRTETDIARSAVSVGHVAVELAKTIFGDVTTVNVLLVGAGKMGVLAAKNLAASGAQRVLVANRTHERGKELAERHGWTASAYGDLPFLLSSIDVVICSTGSPVPVLTKTMLAAAVKQRRYRPIFLIDIAVPRDIEPACGDLDGVYLYDIDDLEDVSRTNQKGREASAAAGERIVEDEVGAIVRWSRERQAAPTIQALREKALEIAMAEAAKTIRMLPGLDDAGAATIQKLAEVIATRLTRGPITALKRATNGAGSGDELAMTIRELYELEKVEVPHESE